MRLGQWWRSSQRNNEKRVLFPMLKGKARDIEHYQAMIRFHIEHDPAWRYPEEWQEEDPELYKILQEGK